MKLRNKIFIIYTILITLPLLFITIVVHFVFASNKSVEVTEQTKNAFAQFNHSFDLMIEDAERDTLSVLYNNELIEILKHYSDDESSPTYRNHQHSNTFNLYLSSMIYKKEQVHGIHIFTPNGQVFSHMNNYGIKQYVNVYKEPWYEIAKELKGSWFIYPESVPDYYQKQSKPMISLVRMLRDPVNEQDLGVIKVDFSPEYIKQLTDKLSGDSWSLSLRERTIIQRGQKELLKMCEDNKSWIQDKKMKNSYLCITDTSVNSEVQIKGIVSKNVIYDDIVEFDKILIIFLMICLCAMLPLAYLTSNYLLKPLETLKLEIKHKQTSTIKYRNNPEVAILSGTYNNLLTEINELVDEIYELNNRNAESEYKMLQSRMDPHFIFNALESINMSAIIQKQFQLSDMISELGKIIRYRLKNENTFVSLGEELSFSWSYLAIMKQRMNEQLLFQRQIDESLMNVQVPKYFIQPLIENAIIHGKGNKPLTVFVKVAQYGLSIVIEVTDDGVGINEKKLKELHHRLECDDGEKKHDKSDSGIALKNIFQRLKLIYGERAAFEIISEINNGTIVMIKIPYDGRGLLV